ncbi:Uracil phosphoribosyltransferase [Crateriforma conspicua]|uniref:Uracil phosphoribosyltransferase n=1 Tax=Crateriforma conspicua TaxID=2527996 RepID=A0A5C6FTE5_9PLAN|nr:Uracil phosphoribosyltransferase [Crateriforma conspicua]
MFHRGRCGRTDRLTSEPSNVVRVSHPLVDHHLSVVRCETTCPAEFRAAVHRLTMLISVPATDHLPTNQVQIQTPVAIADCRRISADVGLVPVLRAGLGMVDPVLQILPDASVWHLGMYRNEETAQPVGYYDKLPNGSPPDVAMILDPMLATGGSIDLVVRRLQRWGVGDIRVLSIIAARPGIQRIAEDFPDVKIFVAAVDPELNERAFIVPGLGDAGDRIFDTPNQD